MAPTESRAQALSPVSVTVETAAHISTSPGESKFPLGKNEGRETPNAERLLSCDFSQSDYAESKEGDREAGGFKVGVLN